MNAYLLGGSLTPSPPKHTGDLLLLFEVHSINCVELHTLTLSIKFSGDQR